MALNPRQLAMLKTVREHGSLKTEALAEQFLTTLQTVRRDISRLSEAGVIERFHGGVRVLDSSSRNTAYAERQRTHAEAKQRIARTVAAAIPPGSSLFMNIGTTVEAVAHELLHAALMHGLRRRERDPRLWNIAADIVVNGMVRKDTAYDLPKGGVENPKLAHLSVEEIYEQFNSGKIYRHWGLSVKHHRAGLRPAQSSMG
jgi:DNA-binding MarR family transcriptional regulator